ncbi:30S ribosomal protein S16 [Candidatus Kaiserbacteria bacterium RIFCSPHIGHO2_01_FULL_55_17]|uniref:Small ribosomal subunit protein bS16 n=1 Tax=Candidatus Kaiserbacteria bacterium RIFCSPHIGHO2_01_FULL_55_17 TaxID=1798484 RepID=A0A1F6D836_9BACT|nr:MAG: 30S ribosomal protein S16 [Candidatus Kaiserbacteria bacterium RIFCSPHIGHO2_01_FULL_55_17]
MLKIRMQRIGKINQPSFRIVVTEHTASPKAGKFVEKVGTYNPKTKERNLNADRIKYWLSVGAKASGTMHNMLISMGIIEGKKVNVLPKKSPPKKEEPAVEAAPAAEAPKEEVPAPELKDNPKAAAEMVTEEAKSAQ